MNTGPFIGYLTASGSARVKAGSRLTVSRVTGTMDAPTARE